jgi:hypothetical protein
MTSRAARYWSHTPRAGQAGRHQARPIGGATTSLRPRPRVPSRAPYRPTLPPLPVHGFGTAGARDTPNTLCKRQRQASAATRKCPSHIRIRCRVPTPPIPYRYCRTPPRCDGPKQFADSCRRLNARRSPAGHRIGRVDVRLGSWCLPPNSLPPDGAAGAGVATPSELTTGSDGGDPSTATRFRPRPSTAGARGVGAFGGSREALADLIDDQPKRSLLGRQVGILR